MLIFNFAFFIFNLSEAIVLPAGFEPAISIENGVLNATRIPSSATGANFIVPL